MQDWEWAQDWVSNLINLDATSDIQLIPRHYDPAGGIIALSVFGGFVFLAAVVTTIVLVIRR